MSQLLTDIRTSLASVISDIDAALANPPAPAPAPEPPAEEFGIPFTVNLFGPAQGAGALSTTLPASPGFLGQALTASTKWLMFSKNFPDVLTARAVVVWSPSSAASQIRFIHFANGPTDIQEIGVIQAPDGMGQPRASGIDITAQLQSLVDGKVDRHIGFQGQNGGNIVLHEVRLEVVFKLPGA